MNPFERHGIDHETSRTLDVAVRRAADAASTCQSVVLSPACSSFDQFSNFAERGRTFHALVPALAAEREEGHHGA